MCLSQCIALYERTENAALRELCASTAKSTCKLEGCIENTHHQTYKKNREMHAIHNMPADLANVCTFKLTSLYGDEKA